MSMFRSVYVGLKMFTTSSVRRRYDEVTAFHIQFLSAKTVLLSSLRIDNTCSDTLGNQMRESRIL